METFTNYKLKKKLKNKGINLDIKKKHQFDNYSYYQVINAYKNIFSTGIEYITDIRYNINCGRNIERYRKCFEVEQNVGNRILFRNIAIKICKKYGIQIKYNETDDELVEKIKSIKYYNHLYPTNVEYSDFIRMYKFEHELRNVLLKYTLIVEESLKNILVSYLNDINAKDTFLTDINQYETGVSNFSNAIKSIKLILDKQTNKHSNPIKRKKDQCISFPYWILINELTLRETLNLIINLNSEHNRNILEKCVNCFTNMNLKHDDYIADEENYLNHLNAMREIFNLIGIFRNNLAHNQPIYCFNVKEFYSTKRGYINYLFPNDKAIEEQYILNANYMSFFADFFGSDRYNSRTQNVAINLSWIIYVLYKIINHLDKNNNFYNELTYVYRKYNIILRPNNISCNKIELYDELFDKLKNYIELDFGIDEIYQKVNDNKPHKQLIISLNKKIKDMKSEMTQIINDNISNNDCLKYTPFLFENKYTKYTGIDKKYFDKLKE